MTSPPSESDFTDEQMMDLATARLHYTWGTDRSTWWRTVRALGYTTGSPRKADLEILVDLWLLAHPSWVEHQRRKAREARRLWHRERRG